MMTVYEDEAKKSRAQIRKILKVFRYIARSVIYHLIRVRMRDSCIETRRGR